MRTPLATDAPVAEPEGQPELWSRTSSSGFRLGERYGRDWGQLTMLELVGQHLQCQCLDPSHSFGPVGTISHDAGKLQNLR